MENTVLITSESLQPLVDKYFKKITAAQWSMFAAGIWDSSTEDTLIDMLIEIVQTLSADVLRLVIPKFQDRLIVEPKYGDNSALDFNVKACLGDSLSDSFAGALKVPCNKCESAEKLTELVESEVSQKVKSFLSVAANSPVWPDDPAVYVNCSMSNMSSLKRMLIHATDCLKKFTSRLKLLGTHMGSKSAEIFINRCCESKVYSLASEEHERCKSSQSIKSKISVASAIQSVGEILQKWSDQTSDTEVVENAKSPPDPSLDAHFAASDIVDQIMCDLQDHSCVNMGSIHDTVRTFFSPTATPTEDTSNKNEEVSKVKFQKVVSNLVEQMMGELQNSCKKQEGKFVVSLKKIAESAKRAANCLRNCKPSDMLPGFIPECITELKVRVRAQNTAMFPVRKNRSSPRDQVDVTEEVESLFEKINSPRISAAQANKTLEDIMSSNEIKTFSKELTDKMYAHMISSHTYLLPLPQLGKCLSDSVISKKRKDGDHFQTSPEVLYAMTEDSVRKFLQKVLIWLEKEPTANTKHNKTLSGALTDIENLIPVLLNKPEEESYLQTEVPSQPSSRYIASENSFKSLNYPHFQRYIESYSLTKSKKRVSSESKISSESSQISLGHLSSSNSSPTIRLEKKPTAHTKHNETLSDTLTDIKNLIPAQLNQLEEESYLQTKVPSQLSSGNIASENSFQSLNYPHFQCHIGSSILNKRKNLMFSKSKISSESSQISLGHLSSSNSSPTIRLEKKPTAHTKHNETLSDTLTDIKNLIPAQLNQLEEESYLQTKVPSQLSSGNIASENSFQSLNYPHFQCHIGSSILNKRKNLMFSKSKISSESSQISLGRLSSSNSYTKSSEKSTNAVLSVQSVTTSPECTRKTNSLTTALMLKLQSKAPKKSRTSLQMDNIDTVIKRLSDKICGEIDFSAISQIKDNKQFNKSVLKDLKKEFGSPKETLKAALSDETAFDDAVLKYLKIHLEALNAAPKQNAVYRVFAAIGTAIMKPFTMCMSAED